MNVRDLIHGPDDVPHITPSSPQTTPPSSMFSVTPVRAASPRAQSHIDLRRASIVLIGMRGVGKTTLGSLAAKALGWELLDTDSIFEQQQNTTLSAYIRANGWESFCKAESQIIHDVLRVHHVGKVIACGGGVVELEANRILLKRFHKIGPVIHIQREKNTVLEFLQKRNQSFPPLLHEITPEAWTRREMFFRECCTFEFVSMTIDIPPEIKSDRSLAFKPVEEEFFRLLKFIHGVECNQVPLSPRDARSYSLALTHDDLRDAIPDLDELSVGIDLWEVRADLLLSQDPTFIAYQIATLRRHSTLPILFTLRTVSQGGRYPNEGPENRNILYHALTLGVEYIDLEMALPDSIFDYLMEYKGNTTAIVSYHDLKGSVTWTSPRTRQLYDRMVKRGADIVKIVKATKSFEDNLNLRRFVASVERDSIPLLAINMGREGKISGVLNSIISPLTHRLLPRAAAPGQVSFVEAQCILFLTGFILPKKYYLFGSPVSHSMFHAIHSTAFATLALPYTYEPKQITTINELREIIASPSFGGASVSTPFQIEIMHYLQHISRHARIIGAVNTIISTGLGTLSGDNTHWRAIKTCLHRSLIPSNVVTSETTALVLGAGGMSRTALYALYQIGVVNIFIYNRTRRRAELLADEFSRLDPLLRITVLNKLDVRLQIAPLPTIVVSAIPATATLKGEAHIDVELREEHFSDSGGVAIELAYERRVTKLLALAQTKRERGLPWAVVEGIELFLEQGYEQVRLWTSRRAPQTKVRKKVLEAYAGQMRTG